MKNLLLKTSLFLAALLLVGNVNAQSYYCSGNNILSGVDFQLGTAYFAPDWNTSSNYTADFANNALTLHLGDATSAVWQAQFPVTCASQTLIPGKTYFLSFDITTNVDLPRVYMKFQAAADNNTFVDLPTQAVSAGTQTISGISVNTAAAFDEILFDFGGNPANADITISNITICDDYSGEAPQTPTYVCNGNNILSGVDFTAGTIWYTADGSNASTNYTETWDNGSLVLQLGDATSGQWNAQFNLTCASQTLTPGKTYFLSYEIKTNVDLPRVYMKMQANGVNDVFVDLPAVSIPAGTDSIVSGITVNTAGAFDMILFDFGGNPANADITISNITICDDYATAVSSVPVTLKVIDQSKGVITNASDHNETNIFCWIDDNLASQNTLTPGNWWYPLYDTTIPDGADANITPNGALIQGADDWTWEITLNAAPGTYEWNPYAKSLGWNAINPNMYAYTGDNADNNLVFTVSPTGEISGHTELVIPDNTGITTVGLNNAVVVGGKSSISAKFEGEANIAVYSIQGVLLNKTTAQSTFEADNLPAGIYVVKINNTTYKAIVQ